MSLLLFFLCVLAFYAAFGFCLFVFGRFAQANIDLWYTEVDGDTPFGRIYSKRPLVWYYPG